VLPTRPTQFFREQDIQDMAAAIRKVSTLLKQG
jgi:hypothetical protein